MEIGNAGKISSNPLLSNIAELLGMSEEFIKSAFYFIVTMLLEISAFWIGGQIEKLKQELNLTKAEILDLQNKAMFGVSIQDFNASLFENVVLAQAEGMEAEQEIKQLRKERRKRPANKTVEKIKALRGETQNQQKQAKQPPRSPKKPPFTPQEKSTKTAPLSFGFISTGTSDNVPKQVHGKTDFVPKQVHPENVPNRTTTGGGTGAKRKKETPDTGTKGVNSHRYNALAEAVKIGKIKPTHRGIKAFKYGGRGMGDDTARNYKKALIRDSIV